MVQYGQSKGLLCVGFQVSVFIVGQQSLVSINVIYKTPKLPNQYYIQPLMPATASITCLC